MSIACGADARRFTGVPVFTYRTVLPRPGSDAIWLLLQRKGAIVLRSHNSTHKQAVRTWL